MHTIVYNLSKAYNDSTNIFNFLLTNAKLYNASMQSASTPIASKYYSLALKNSFFTYKQFPLFTSAFALYRSY